LKKNGCVAPNPRRSTNLLRFHPLDPTTRRLLPHEKKTIEFKRFTPTKTKQVSLCCLYLGATTVSDICNAKGIHLASGIRQGQRSIFQSKPKGPMVKQDHPDKSSWSIWRRLLSLFSSSNDKLHQSLQSWTSFGNSLRRQWPFLYSPSLHLVYHHFENCFESHHEIRPNL
jgi:hypothetical protein